MADVIRFRLKLRPPPSGRPQKKPSTIVLFPQCRRAALVARAAERWRSFNRAEAGDYLEALLEFVQDELPVGHVEQELIDDQLIALARAIKDAARSSTSKGETA